MKCHIRYGFDTRFLGANPITGRGEFRMNEDAVLFGQRVPKGFITDGISIPLWLAWFLNPTGRGFAAAVVHDWRYTVHDLTRPQADAELWRNMRALGCGRFHAGAAWLAVRLFGKSHWPN
jgi:hypothetical protein